MQWARGQRNGVLVIKLQLVTGDLIYRYQWAVAGAVIMAIAGGRYTPPLYSSVLGPELAGGCWT